MIRGYHEYQSIWEAEVRESLTCIREPGNVRDPYPTFLIQGASWLEKQNVSQDGVYLHMTLLT